MYYCEAPYPFLHHEGTMFESDAFQSWLTVLLGGLLFALLFCLMGMMSELVLQGEWQITTRSASLGALAFIGYIAVATFIRTHPPAS